MGLKTRYAKWKKEHPDAFVVAAQAGIVISIIGLGFGLSRTFRMDAAERVEKSQEKIRALMNENSMLRMDYEQLSDELQLWSSESSADVIVPITSEELDAMYVGKKAEVSTVWGDFEVGLRPEHQL